MKNIIYCRRSSEDSTHQVLSIESQRNELAGLAREHNLKIDKIFEESKSARYPGRPEFEKLIKLIEKHPGSVLLVWKLDRLARNPKDEGTIKWLLQTNVIAKIITPERTYNPEDNTLISGVEFSMAAQYSIDLSKNVKRGNKTKLEKGELPGKAPIGYTNNPITRKIDIDPIKSVFIQQLFELYSTGGYSLRDVAEIMFKKGFKSKTGKQHSKAMMQHLLTTTFYYGTITRNGQQYQGIHQPLITKAVFDQTQFVMSGKTRPRRKTHFYPLRGFMNCYSCGCALTATKQKGHVYYYCTNGKGKCEQHKKYLRDIKADELVSSIFNEVKFDMEEFNIAYEAAKVRVLNEDNFNGLQKTELAGKQKTAEQQLANLIKVISTDPSMTNALKPQILNLEAEIKSITERIIQLNDQTPEQALATLELTKKTFLQASSASFDYLQGDDNKKSELAKNLLLNLKVENQNVQCYQFKSKFQLLAEAPKKMNLEQWWAVRDSNPRRPKGRRVYSAM